MVNLPIEIVLSIPLFQDEYWSVGVVTGSGMKHSPPIVFAVSIPINAQNRGAGIEFIRLMLSEEGKEISIELLPRSLEIITRLED